MGSATSSVTDKSFEAEVIKSELPVLVDFWAEWCGPCRSLAPKLDEIALELKGQVRIVKLNIDDNPEMPAKYNVKGIPTMILFKRGQQVDQIVGNHPKENIKEVLVRHT